MTLRNHPNGFCNRKLLELLLYYYYFLNSKIIPDVKYFLEHLFARHCVKGFMWIFHLILQQFMRHNHCFHFGIVKNQSTERLNYLLKIIHLPVTCLGFQSLQSWPPCNSATSNFFMFTGIHWTQKVALWKANRCSLL